ncbi:hypothetical protein NDU88_006602 [Pleurodeles waltl]|uniref:Uncharacterized protein n=1 Tax=Pleurodeles waltl TaxID=8319 RepID=A0AAV7RRN6_PLEWA|nr:hypothetical protein NDU88_006602 [Pleurodeles waltl]
MLSLRSGGPALSARGCSLEVKQEQGNSGLVPHSVTVDQSCRARPGAVRLTTGCAYSGGGGAQVPLRQTAGVPV